MFARLRERVKEGVPLARAMSMEEETFPPMACAMAEAGEASGKLDESLARQPEALDRAAALRQTIISSLIYPALLIVIAIGVVSVMLLVVVPQFRAICFPTRARSLPFITRARDGGEPRLANLRPGGILVLVVAGIRVRHAMDVAALGAPRFRPQDPQASADPAC